MHAIDPVQLHLKGENKTTVEQTNKQKKNCNLLLQIVGSYSHYAVIKYRKNQESDVPLCVCMCECVHV